MNKVTLDFIEYMIFFLKQGYSIHDLLDLCKMLDFKKQVRDLEKYLYQGETTTTKTSIKNKGIILRRVKKNSVIKLFSMLKSINRISTCGNRNKTTKIEKTKRKINIKSG